MVTNKKKFIAEIEVQRKTSIRQAMRQLDLTGQGILLLISKTGSFERTVTDGDLRRLLLSGVGLDDDLDGLPVIDPVTLVRGDYSRRQALAKMSENFIHHLPVLNDDGYVIDLLDRKSLDEQILLSTPHIGDLEREFVDEAFRTNWIAPLGPNVDAFEKEIAEEVGLQHAAAVSSGTAAIHLALRLLDIGHGDQVFCSSLTFVATANPIIYQGAEPIFIDSEPKTWNMSPVALERAFAEAKREGKLPKAVLVVNLYGLSADMDPIVELCDSYGVPLIEDAAESLGARYKGRQSGSFGKLGVFSFNGNKIITTSGGGMLVSNDEMLIERARFLSTQAREPVAHYEHKTVGYNYRMSNILAGVGRGQLKVLSQRVEARRAVFNRYKEGLYDIDSIVWMPEPEGSYSNRWLTTGHLLPNMTKVTSETLMKSLADEMIEARPVWKPMQLQPIFEGSQYYQHSSSISVSENLFNTGFCLPSGSNMSQEQQGRVIEVLRNIFKV